MQKVVHRKGYARVVHEVVFRLVSEVKEPEEYESPTLAVRCLTLAHVVNIAVELRQEDVDVLAAVEFWEYKIN